MYVQPPDEWDGHPLIWKLKRCLYGLNDAPRAWYERVEQELRNSVGEGKISLYDEAMFMWHDQDSLIGFYLTRMLTTLCTAALHSGIQMLLILYLRRSK